MIAKRLTSTAILPKRAQPGDAGFDLYADEQVTIAPKTWALVSTGIAVAIDPSKVGLVCPRSGLAYKQGVTVLNAPGVVDSGFRGPIGVILINHSLEPFEVKPGDRIAQLVVGNIDTDDLTEVDELPLSERGAGGFGSTGV